MSEVLDLQYKASGPSLLIELDAVRTVTDSQGVTRTVTVLGAPRPVAHMTLAALGTADAQLLADLQSVLVRLEPIVRAAATAALTDPAAIATQQAQLAKARQDLEFATAQAQAQQADLAQQIAAQQAQLASLQAQAIAAAQPDLAAMQEKAP